MEKHKYYQRLVSARSFSSFRPEKRAVEDCKYYDAIMAQMPNEETQQKFDRLFQVWISAISRCASAAVTGPARFNYERNRKAMMREMRVWGEMSKWVNRVIENKNRVEMPKVPALEEARKEYVHALENHAFMKNVNALLRKKDYDKAELLALCKGDQKLADNISTDQGGFFGAPGFRPFQLTNALGKIKRAKSRLESLEKGAVSEEKQIDGVKIEENTDDDRLCLFFDSKPAAEMIVKLKKNGFKWSPSNSCWQRQLTENARRSLKVIFA